MRRQDSGRNGGERGGGGRRGLGVFEDSQCFFQPHLASGLLLRRGREESTGNSKPSVVETNVVVTNVVHSAGSKASFAEVGLMVPSHQRGFQ